MNDNGLKLIQTFSRLFKQLKLEEQRLRIKVYHPYHSQKYNKSGNEN